MLDPIRLKCYMSERMWPFRRRAMRATNTQNKRDRNVGQVARETGNPQDLSRSTPSAIRSSKLTLPIFPFNKKLYDFCDNYLDIHREQGNSRRNAKALVRVQIMLCPQLNLLGNWCRLFRFSAPASSRISSLLPVEKWQHRSLRFANDLPVPATPRLVELSQVSLGARHHAFLDGERLRLSHCGERGRQPPGACELDGNQT